MMDRTISIVELESGKREIPCVRVGSLIVHRMQDASGETEGYAISDFKYGWRISWRYQVFKKADTAIAIATKMEESGYDWSFAVKNGYTTQQRSFMEELYREAGKSKFLDYAVTNVGEYGPYVDPWK